MQCPDYEIYVHIAGLLSEVTTVRLREQVGSAMEAKEYGWEGKLDTSEAWAVVQVLTNWRDGHHHDTPELDDIMHALGEAIVSAESAVQDYAPDLAA